MPKILEMTVKFQYNNGSSEIHTFGIDEFRLNGVS